MIENRTFHYEEKTIRAKIAPDGVFFRLEDIYTIQKVSNLDRMLEQFMKEDGWKKFDGNVYVDEPTFYLVVFRSNKSSVLFKSFAKNVFRELHINPMPVLINTEQKGELYNRLREKVLGSKDVKSVDNALLSKAWVAFNSHFRIASYKDLPAYRYEDALYYIDNVIEGPEEQVTPEPTATVQQELATPEQEAPTLSPQQEPDIKSQAKDSLFSEDNSIFFFGAPKSFLLQLDHHTLTLKEMPDPVSTVLEQIKAGELSTPQIKAIGQACWEAR